MKNKSLRAGLAVWLAVLLLSPAYALPAPQPPSPAAPAAGEPTEDSAWQVPRGSGLVKPARASYLPQGGTSEGKPEKASKLQLPESALSGDEKIVHLLNRIGFGPRPGIAGEPGEVERVKQMGLAAYLEQQLHPETISDKKLEARLAGFDTLHMDRFELFASYPPPPLLRAIAERLGPQAGLDQASMDLMFPELVRRRERQQRRAQPGEDGREGARRRDRERNPQARMRRAMNSPNRVVIEMSQAKLLRAVYSERQLEEVMTDFWFNHFNVFVGKGLERWLLSSYERDAIRPHALGKFRDLLGATAKHPAMLFYLDNWMSAAPGSDASERALRASYARYLEEQARTAGSLPLEILQRRGADTARLEQMLEFQTSMMAMDAGRGGRRGRLGRRQRPEQQQQRRRRQRGLNENYARELLELHTLGVDGGYTQQDVIEVARCFTGWTMVPLHIGPSDFIYLDELHDKGTKVVLGQKIENGGQQDGERVLDLVARHPSTARFLSTKLARRFVADGPPATLVTKMAETFRKTDGDIRAVLRTLFTAEEFWSPAAVRAKVKTPFEFVASAARATGAELADFPPGLALSLRELGMPLYAAEPPTGYKDTAEAWVSTGGLLNRMKIALGLAVNRLPGTRVRIPAAWRQAETTDELVAAISKQVLYQPMSLTTRAALDAELKKIPKANPIGGRQAPARIALGWLLASPEFQRR